MQTPLISILTPFKNTESYLLECLESILSQSYTHWELLIVDDGSTDSSYNLVNSYAQKDTRIKLLKNNGVGIISALQLAFKSSSGIFITRMDSDDIMPTNKLQVLVESLLLHGKQHVATGLVNYFSSTGISNGYKKYEDWLNNLTRLGTNYTEIYKECVIPSPCWMLHRDDLILVDAFNPNRYPEDYDLTFRFYKHQFKIIPCNLVLHYWRDYQTRTSRTHSHYAENTFLEIKAHYFLEIDYNPTKTLVIWGAGIKGKTLAKKFIEANISFEWICDNPNKIGKKIYQQTLKSFTFLETITNFQSIITVANEDAQKSIKDYLENQNKKSMMDYFFFC